MGQLINDAKVVIRMKGLGILHYNGIAKKWEAILLRGIERHDLKIKITKIFSNGKPPEWIEYLVPDEVKRVNIKTNNVTAPESHIFHKCDFEYHPGTDAPMDAGWILDLSKELYKEPVKLAKKTDNCLTLLTVDNATLYTASQHDTSKPYLMIDSDLKPIEHKPPKFVNPRAMADFVGMDIVWNNASPLTAFMYDDSASGIPPLIFDKDIARYEVFIDNNCLDPNNPNNPANKVCQFLDGDFRVYHTHLVDMKEVFSQVPPRLGIVAEKMQASFIINKSEDFRSEKVTELTEAIVFEFAKAIEELVRDYDGKTNDCGFLMCSELKNDMNDTLDGLIPA